MINFGLGVSCYSRNIHQINLIAQINKNIQKESQTEMICKKLQLYYSKYHFKQ